MNTITRVRETLWIDGVAVRVREYAIPPTAPEDLMPWPGDGDLPSPAGDIHIRLEIVPIEFVPRRKTPPELGPGTPMVILR